MTLNRLRTKVAVTFGTISLIVAVLVALIAYQLVVSYLSSQREQFAVNRTLIDADTILSTTNASSEPFETLRSLSATGTSQRLLRVDGEWFASGVSVSPDDLPEALLSQALESGAATQRFTIGGTLYLGVAVQSPRGTFVEVFPLTELVRTSDLLRIALLVAVLLAAALGAVVGWLAARRLLQPLRDLAHRADELGAGNLDIRMKVTGDADLDPIAKAFDNMAEAVQERIARERRFVANVSHELRTPVTVALGTLEILDGRKDTIPEPSRRLFTLLGQQVTKLAHMVIDLIELGTLAPGSHPRWQHVDACEVVSVVLSDRGLPTSLIHQVGDTELVTDPSRLERVLSNLVDNAELHGGGVTSIAVEGRDGSVLISVRDAGPGIPAEQRDQVFELFNRGLEADPGTGSGLGLTIVAEQVGILGASIDVEDADGGGACFVVTFPVRPEGRHEGSETST